MGTGKEGWFCCKVSEGCTNCYSEAVNFRYGNKLAYNYANLHRIQWVLKPNEFKDWLKLKEPSKIFVCDMTDLFHAEMPDFFRHRIFDAMKEADWHTYQVLTKRPEYMREFLKAFPEYCMDNVWYGTSVESKKVLSRIDILREIPVKTRFLSIEPLLESLGPVNLSGIRWAIVGAESGNLRRPFDKSFASEIKEQCRRDGTAFYFKQGSHRFSGRDRELEGQLWEEFPSDSKP